MTASIKFFLTICLLIALSVQAAPKPKSFRKNIKWNCPKDVLFVASEVVDMELSGPWLETKTTCLEQKNFKYVQSYHSAPTENPVTEYMVLDKKKGDEFSIEKVEKVNDLGEYKVTFNLKKDSKQHQDSLVFVFHETAPKQAASGCADILVRPKAYALWSHCKPK